MAGSYSAYVTKQSRRVCRILSTSPSDERLWLCDFIFQNVAKSDNVQLFSFFRPGVTVTEVTPLLGAL
jgi:hypothetical protein